jgi:hypothetical protein
VHISEFEAITGYIYDDNMAETMTARKTDIEVEDQVIKTIEKIMKVAMDHKIQAQIGAVLKVRPEVMEIRKGLSGNSPYDHNLYCGHCGKYVPFGGNMFRDKKGALRHSECGSILRTRPHKKRGRKALRKQEV